MLNVLGDASNPLFKVFELWVPNCVAVKLVLEVLTFLPTALGSLVESRFFLKCFAFALPTTALFSLLYYGGMNLGDYRSRLNSVWLVLNMYSFTPSSEWISTLFTVELLDIGLFLLRVLFIGFWLCYFGNSNTTFLVSVFVYKGYVITSDEKFT
jgi:hypothetical protein